jgi:endonuclease/exonuclease/phosphatase (EEP) superfamily protein YafD
MSRRSALRCLATAILGAVMLGGCVTVPVQQYALVSLAQGSAGTRTAALCGDPQSWAASRAGAGEDGVISALDSSRVRIVSWNLHKQQDKGWREELGRLSEQSDLLLLQEAALTPELSSALAEARYVWILASSFVFGGTDFGVVIAARVRPVFFCTARAFEPLLGIPKSQLVAEFSVAGAKTTLVVATIHALNFTFDLKPYRGQLDSLGKELARHSGPMVLAGDFNTWSEVREQSVEAFARGLLLTAIAFPDDDRSRFFGRPADWAYVRDADVLGAVALKVTSSDHNPLLVTLRLR